MYVNNVFKINSYNFYNLLNFSKSSSKKSVNKNILETELIDLNNIYESLHIKSIKLNKEIPVYTFLSKREKKKLKKNNELTKKELKEVWYYQKNEKVKFIVTDTTTYIRFFNNKDEPVMV